MPAVIHMAPPIPAISALLPLASIAMYNTLMPTTNRIRPVIVLQFIMGKDTL